MTLPVIPICVQIFFERSKFLSLTHLHSKECKESQDSIVSTKTSWVVISSCCFDNLTMSFSCCLNIVVRVFLVYVTATSNMLSILFVEFVHFSFCSPLPILTYLINKHQHLNIAAKKKHADLQTFVPKLTHLRWKGSLSGDINHGWANNL